MVDAAPSFYWFDYETFGTSPLWDKPSQFAGLRTDMNLQPIGEPLIIYCRPPDDYLPHPEACRVTGMHPSDVHRDGLSEVDFIDQIVRQLGAPGTCSVGYNSIRFDDEFTRHTLFRNFHDAYQQEWKDGNSRWDLLDVVRLARALRPEGINWPENDDGTPSNRLELLTRANAIEHSNAHDAMADVYATIEMARLLKNAQPKLYNYAFEHRDKHSVSAMLNVVQRTPCVQISGMIPSTTAHAAVIVPIARHPVNQNGVIVLDLRTDPSELLSLSSEEIAARVFTSKDELAADKRIHLRVIQINRCPVLVPLKTLRKQDAQRIGLDLTTQLERVAVVQQLFDTQLEETIRQAMTRTFDDIESDVDGSLYSGGFFSQGDKQRFDKIRTSTPELLAQMHGLFDDPRVNEMLFRYRARNFPQTLDEHEQENWQIHRSMRLTRADASWLTASTFHAAMQAIEWGPEEQDLKQSLQTYAASLLAGLDQAADA